MKTLIQILGTATSFLPAELAMFVVSCDVDANGGQGNFVMTNDPKLAKPFDSAADAMLYWGRQSEVCPLRADGRPNKPLTALTVTLIAFDG